MSDALNRVAREPKPMKDLKDIREEPKSLSAMTTWELKRAAKKAGLPHKGGRELIIERLTWAVRCTQLVRKLESAAQELASFRASKLLVDKVDGSQEALRVSCGSLIAIYGQATFAQHAERALKDYEYAVGLQDEKESAGE